MSKIDNNYLKSEYEFQTAILNNDDNNFLNIFKNYLDVNHNIKEFAKLSALSGNYIYFPKKNIESFNQSVLIVIHELSRTGAPIVALDTAKVLKDNGYFVTIISLKNGPLLSDIIDYGIPVIIMNDLRYIQYTNNGIDHFKNFLDIDVFINSFDKIIMITATLYNLVRRYINTSKKIYWWIHEGSDSYNIIGNRMPKNITPNIKVWCGGEYSANQLKKYGFKYYPDVINYGVFDEGVYKKSKNKNKVSFLLAGTISTRKGQLHLLNAIKTLSANQLAKSEFIFIGDPYDGDIEGFRIKKEIEEFIKNNSNNNIKLYKSISRNELFELYKKIDVLVLASKDDPMPVVATENLMLGNIVLCSTNTGTSYYLKNKENGFVFLTGNVDSLASEISYIIDNISKLDDLRKKGRKVFEEYFDMEVFKKNILGAIMEE